MVVLEKVVEPAESGRRLELAPESTSYIRAAFVLPFDASYSGDPAWIAQMESWLDADFWPSHWRRRAWRNQSSVLAELPRLESDSFGFSVGVNEPALVGRIVVPSPSYTYPPHHQVSPSTSTHPTPTTPASQSNTRPPCRCLPPVAP